MRNLSLRGKGKFILFSLAVLPRGFHYPEFAPNRFQPQCGSLATVKQVEAALGFGRTKVNELMNQGRLERVAIDGGVRITVASVRALAGSTAA